MVGIVAGGGRMDKPMLKAGRSFLGLKFDYDANAVRGVDTIITLPDSQVKAALITTNEELMIARDTMHIVQNEEE